MIHPHIFFAVFCSGVSIPFYRAGLKMFLPLTKKLTRMSLTMSVFFPLVYYPFVMPSILSLPQSTLHPHLLSHYLLFPQTDLPLAPLDPLAQVDLLTLPIAPHSIIRPQA